MSECTVRFRAADGLSVEFDGKPDAELRGDLKLAGFRWARSRGVWVKTSSRDGDPLRVDGWVASVASVLGRHGIDVETDVDATRRPAAEREQDRTDRAARRAEGLGAAAQAADRRSTQLWEQGHRMAEQIPMGQPVMPGHHSYGRDTRFRAKIRRTTERSFEEMDRAGDLAQRARAAERTAGRLDDVGFVRRRLAECERAVVEAEARRDAAFSHGAVDAEADGVAEVERLVGDRGFYRDRLAELEEAGAVVWGREHFEPGDRIARHGGGQADGVVRRVNAKSLSCTWFHGFDPAADEAVLSPIFTASSTNTTAYDKVKAAWRVVDGAAVPLPYVV